MKVLNTALWGQILSRLTWGSTMSFQCVGFASQKMVRTALQQFCQGLFAGQKAFLAFEIIIINADTSMRI